MAGKVSSSSFPCGSCGARLEYSPESSLLKCPYCGQESMTPDSSAAVPELDFHQYFARATEQGELLEKQTVTCSACSAVSIVESDISLSSCPFCGSLLTARAKAGRLVRPGAILPFKINRNRAAELFRGWLSGLWFAPGGLRRNSTTSGGIKGIYLPYWTYDVRVTTWFEGERGEDYQEAGLQAEQGGRGNGAVRGRSITRTRWHSSGGCVVSTFDDVLVPAGCSLPPEAVAMLEPWDLKSLVPYSDEYMSGFQSEAYQLDMGEGFERARALIERGVRGSVERHIGGQHQRINAMRSQYDDITFKHVLLPVWISAYRYRKRTFRFIVNARTGQVLGERPWSVFRIAIALIGMLLVLLLIAILVKQ
ncbi:MAG: hypothetical protein Q7V04_08065 [Deltaproteobacteria bacterium]|nr:hypothetical protein [Deltaproteobacteria bacterium]